MSTGENSPDIAHDSVSDSEQSESTPSSNCGDDVVEEMSLELLFASINDEADNVEVLFETLQPIIEHAIKKKPNSTLHKEILQFVEDQIKERSSLKMDESAKTSCTIAQGHAIVYVVNDKQFMIQEDVSLHPNLNVEKFTTQTDMDYNVFMDEMAKLT